MRLTKVFAIAGLDERTISSKSLISYSSGLTLIIKRQNVIFNLPTGRQAIKLSSAIVGRLTNKRSAIYKLSSNPELSIMKHEGNKRTEISIPLFGDGSK